MKPAPAEADNNRESSHARIVLLEALAVALAGLLFGLAANQLSPRGLTLTRNYFPGSSPPASPAPPGGNQATNAAGTNTPAASLADLAAARLKEKGLQLVNSNLVVQLYRDPKFQQELFIFVDARDDQHYQEGHVPGAYQFDHYRAENYLAAVLPVCQTAEQIVVYCNGGNCEDSEFAAVTLASAGVPKDRLLIYGGGMTEWVTNGLPIEVGSRKSGVLKDAKGP